MKSDSRPTNTESNCPQAQVASVIFEDNHVVVVIKAQGVLVDDMVTQLKKDRPYCVTVHRLDQVTGGVMLFAKSSKAAARLSEQIKDHKFEKTYLAVVLGIPKKREDTLVHHLLKNETKNIVTVVPLATVGAKRAELTYQVVNKPPVDKKDMSLVKVNLVTGRTHQIRVQMAQIGNPIFGDAKYVGRKTGPNGEEIITHGDKLGKGWDIALWAHELVFTHPTTDEVMRFIVNPPETVPWTSFEFERKKNK
ncbi:MAG: RluA family pseudouridine synthase [Christensenellaceae bacterium]|jgi:23S rRNA pseudouridine1911/1915/1917 synthase|nr:RluA family pseudouridine synthase [Christensenellaceae bacterium]